MNQVKKRGKDYPMATRRYRENKEIKVIQNAVKDICMHEKEHSESPKIEYNKKKASSRDTLRKMAKQRRQMGRYLEMEIKSASRTAPQKYKHTCNSMPMNATNKKEIKKTIEDMWTFLSYAKIAGSMTNNFKIED